MLKKPLSPLRQVIARRMLENWNAVPHVTQFDEADITTLNELRKKYAPGLRTARHAPDPDFVCAKSGCGTSAKAPDF